MQDFDGQDLTGIEVRGTDDQKIGHVEQVYVDDLTGEPEWFTVTTGFFGTNVSFVPLAGATLDGTVLRVPHDLDTVKDSPDLDPEQFFSDEEEAVLYSHYGREYAPPVADPAVVTDDAPVDSDLAADGVVTNDTTGTTRLRRYVAGGE